MIKFSKLFRTAIKQQHNRTTKCVCNIDFHFVCRSVAHAVLVLSFRLSKVADNILIPGFIKTYILLDGCF